MKCYNKLDTELEILGKYHIIRNIDNNENINISFFVDSDKNIQQDLKKLNKNIEEDINEKNKDIKLEKKVKLIMTIDQLVNMGKRYIITHYNRRIRQND